MVGMAVARALSERFREVVVIERDVLSRDAPEHRRGAPQSQHIHNLMLRGQQELEQLFPGFFDEALALGASRIDHGRDVARCTDLGFCPLFETGYESLSASRALFEFAERKRFLALCPGIIWLEGTRVESLLVEGEGSSRRAVGVVTDNAAQREVHAQLVVDCSGRSALWKRWFSEHQIPLPEETVVDSRCGYASRFYRRKQSNQHGVNAMMVDPLYPHRPQWGVIVPIEHDQWLVTLGGFNEMYPPNDEQGFESFGERLQTPLFSAWLAEAEPFGPVRTMRKLEKRWNHFEAQKHPLAGFLAVGDSAWAFNPLYGQGMSIGITCARILRDTLRKDATLETLPRRYYKAAKAFAQPPWRAAALLDFAWPKTAGDRPWYTGLAQKVGHSLLRAAQFDNHLFMKLLRGAHLLAKPHEIATPRVVFALLRYWVHRLTGTLPATDLTRLPQPSSPRLAAVAAPDGARDPGVS
jgi:2-polyprenyl-6-methoxyphenol hydroxylase-like FAD-dependent oxidoreductase